MTVSDKASIASYHVSEVIAQNMKAYTLSELLILPACKKIVRTRLGKKAATTKRKIFLSNDTVRRRILEMSSNIEKIVCDNKLQN